MKQITSTFENNIHEIHHLSPGFKEDNGSQEMQVINLYPEYKRQTFRGFGGAFTEAAGYVYSQWSENKKQEFIKAYFSDEGLGYTYGRTHMDSCDFSLDSYSALNDPNDTQLNSFNLCQDEKYIIPLINDAQKEQSQLQIMLSPWSPPAFMKTNNNRCGGGKLKPEYYDLWANYLCKYITAYKEKGIDVFAASAQNEPNAKQTWESCQYSAEEEKDFITNHFAPALKKHGLDDIILTMWDHNKERIFDRATKILDEDVIRQKVGAIGYHWYSGDHFEALDMTHKTFPDKELFFTEGCVEFSRFEQGEELQHAEMYAHEIIGSLNNGLNLFLDWNLCLDSKGGPNHVHNYCTAPIMATPEGDDFNYSLIYHTIGHFSRYIKPGAVGIGLSCYTKNIEATAFLNLDGDICCVMMNTENRTQKANLRINGKIAELLLPKNSISTFIIDRSEVI